MVRRRGPVRIFQIYKANFRSEEGRSAYIIKRFLCSSKLQKHYEDHHHIEMVLGTQNGDEREWGLPSVAHVHFFLPCQTNTPSS